MQITRKENLMVDGILFSYKIAVGIEVRILHSLGSLYIANATIYFLWYISENIAFLFITAAPAFKEQVQK